MSGFEKPLRRKIEKVMDWYVDTKERGRKKMCFLKICCVFLTL
jgi:hypothetical protein